MKIEEFYLKFIEGFDSHKRYFGKGEKKEFISYTDWTRGMENYLKKTFEKNNKCTCICKNKSAKKNDMKEFLTIDYTVFVKNERATLDNLIDQDIIYAVEHENKVAYDNIAYSISKLLNISAENKIMIGYVRKARKEEKQGEKKEEIFEKLHSQIQKMGPDRFRENEKLLVILGHNGMTNSSHYKAKLFYLKSKRSKNLNSENKKEE